MDGSDAKSVQFICFVLNSLCFVLHFSIPVQMSIRQICGQIVIVSLGYFGDDSPWSKNRVLEQPMSGLPTMLLRIIDNFSQQTTCES
jgi:hypothetical protein